MGGSITELCSRGCGLIRPDVSGYTAPGNLYNPQATHAYSRASPGSVSLESGLTSSPALPALETSPNDAGFSDLYRQIEDQMDEIQARHSPFSSPRTSLNHHNRAGPTHASSHGVNGVTHMPRPQRNPVESTYGANEIIPMYAPARPASPTAAGQLYHENHLQMPQAARPYPSQGQHADYEQQTQYSYSHAHTSQDISRYADNPRTFDQAASQFQQQSGQASHTPDYQLNHMRSSSRRNPTFGTTLAQADLAASPYRVASQSIDQFKHSLRPLPPSPPTLQEQIYATASSSAGATSSSRTRQENSAHFPPIAQSAPPRPPTSSQSSFLSNGGRPIHNELPVRPLPVPQEVTKLYSSSPPEMMPNSPFRATSNSTNANDVSARDGLVKRPNHAPNSNKEIYGRYVPDDSQTPRDRLPVIHRNGSQSAPDVASPIMGRSMSYGNSIQRQPITGTSSVRSSPSMQSSTSQGTFGAIGANGSNRNYMQLSGPGYSGTPASPALSYASSSNSQRTPATYDSHSEPYNYSSTSNPHSTPTTKQPQYPALKTSLGSSYRDPSSTPSGSYRTASSASRSTSFSASSEASTSTSVPSGSIHYASRRQLGHSGYPSGRPVRGLSESAPSIISSPSISISISIADTSYSSAAPTFGPRPRANKHTSLSPSSKSLSAGGYFGSMGSLMTRRDSQKDRRRLEGMGLHHFNPALLSHIGTAAKDRVPRGMNVKGAIRE